MLWPGKTYLNSPDWIDDDMEKQLTANTKIKKRLKEIGKRIIEQPSLQNTYAENTQV